MEASEFVKAIGSVNSMWSIAAFAIAAVLALANLLVRGSGPGAKRKAPISANLLWATVAVICIMGLAPIAANGFLETRRMNASSIYRVRVVALDEQNVPVSGAHVRTSVSGETTTTADGDAAISIPRGSMPADGKVTIFADKTSAFLHGNTEIRLADDLNPSVLIHLQRDTASGVSGRVEDPEGHPIEGALVSLPGGDSTRTSETGNFSLNAHAAAGQIVTIHAEKRGYEPADQSHPAAADAAVIVLNPEHRSKK
ncbi:MAG: carboxypeptidase regulatory-like domain-containing protein [Acidobacteriaceae bacterium]|nr:carboxypeptidase regulatory-like domain-containing protein [Acidobacteriaceae bacterium]